jgi:hypothetical protein
MDTQETSPDQPLRLSRPAERWLIHFAVPRPGGALPPHVLSARELGDLIAAAELHGVRPALLQGLSSMQPAEAGAAHAWQQVVEAARVRAVYQTGFEMLLAHHGERVLNAFRDQRLEGCVIKGAVFGRRLFSDPSLRTFTDIDVLVSARHRAAATDIMTQLGFELFQFADRIGRDYHEDKWILPSQRDVMIEVHIDLVHSPKLRAAMSVRFEDVLEAGKGDPENATALLLVAGAHGAVGHQFDRLQHLADVHQAAEGAAGPIDAARLRQISERCGVLLGVVTALGLAHRAFGATSCREIARALSPSAYERLPGLLLTPRLVVQAQTARRLRGSWRRKLFRQLMIRTGRSKPGAECGQIARGP